MYVNTPFHPRGTQGLSMLIVLSDDLVLLFWRMIINIFFREIRSVSSLPLSLDLSGRGLQLTCISLC